MTCLYEPITLSETYFSIKSRLPPLYAIINCCLGGRVASAWSTNVMHIACRSRVSATNLNNFCLIPFQMDDTFPTSHCNNECQHQRKVPPLSFITVAGTSHCSRVDIVQICSREFVDLFVQFCMIYARMVRSYGLLLCRFCRIRIAWISMIPSCFFHDNDHGFVPL